MLFLRTILAGAGRTPQGHLGRAGGWWGPFSNSKGNGRRGRKPPSNTWIRVPEQSLLSHADSYQVTREDHEEIQAGRALFFTGKALAKAELICVKQGGLEILWYWTARRSNPWVIDDLILPDDQYATSGTCYASPEVVLAVSRQARRAGRIILGAGHSHGRLAVFSSLTDLELMSQLAAERVGFASQVQHLARGAARKRSLETPGDDPDAASRPGSIFEITFDDNPEVWVTVKTRVDLSEDDLEVELDRIQRHQVSLFTTHNADGEHYFPVHHVTSCLHCGTRLDDYSAEDVSVHLIGPQTLSEDEQNDLIAELDEKAPRGGFFRERWGWGGSKKKHTFELDEADDKDKGDDSHDDTEAKEPADFFVYRHGQRVGKVPAVVLEEAAYRCPALARALGWSEKKTRVECTAETNEDAAEDLVVETRDKVGEEPDDGPGEPRAEEAGDGQSDLTGGSR
ncbi:MAG: hypothetical protein A2V98_22255 [Planctomycetes bacterium RBG_16_64_12]|nr:MAG: hypothetical protein A2V98_22255 [Planctomycetes bacterium RBG_16_64_12]